MRPEAPRRTPRKDRNSQPLDEGRVSLELPLPAPRPRPLDDRREPPEERDRGVWILDLTL